MEELEKLKTENKFLKDRCKELWNENESLKFKLFLKSYDKIIKEKQ